LVRKLIHAMGFRFRLHVAGLPGRPDIVLRSRKKIVQVHGCFWHQHGCNISSMPRTRTDYWWPKLSRNVERDKESHRLLTEMGWQVFTVWECELKDIPRLRRGLRRFLDQKGLSTRKAAGKH
jgi:DNA mismatch endonuclease (patch repair protein)